MANWGFDGRESVPWKKRRRRRRARVAGPHVEERRNPIPPGVYWVDVVRPDGKVTKNDPLDNWRYWLTTHQQEVEVVNRETRFAKSSWFGDTDIVIGEFTVFRVKVPVQRWPNDAGIGLPTIAVKGEETRSSDQENPNYPSGWDLFKDDVKRAGDSAADVLSGAGSLVLVGLVLYALSSKGKKQ